MPEMLDVRRVGYAPITRIDARRREIEVTATSEAVDAYGTVFDFDASRAAFTQWLGNVREMHESVAVGRRVAVECDAVRRQIRVRLRVSRGAESTWQKILDGTLCGASIGAANVRWRETRRGELPGSHLDGTVDPNEAVRVATSYELVELSLVDNPANPDCVGIALVRAATPDPDLLDDLAEEPGEPEAGTGTGTAATAAIHGAMRSLATSCGCPRCAEVGDILADDGADRGERAHHPARLAAELRRATAALAALRGDLADLARAEAAAREQLLARLARIEAQPMPGGPVLRPAEKLLGGMGAGTNVAERVAALQAAGGKISDPASQVALAAEIMRLQQG